MDDHGRSVMLLLEADLEQRETGQITPLVIGDQQYWMICVHSITVATALGCGAMRRRAGEGRYDVNYAGRGRLLYHSDCS